MRFLYFRSALTIIPVLVVATFLIFPTDSRGQSSLFNIPTADTLPKGEPYIEVDFDGHFAKYRNGGWQSYGVMAIYGVNSRSEVGINAYSTRGESGFESIELQPNFKFKAYENEKLGLIISGGVIAYVPVKGGRLRNSQVAAYAVVGKSFDHDLAPSFTAGAYELLGSNPDRSSRRGFLLGIQQPVHKRVSLVADWNTANNRFGYAAVGVGVILTKRNYLYSAYYFGNEGRANNSFGIYYGFTF